LAGDKDLGRFGAPSGSAAVLTVMLAFSGETCVELAADVGADRCSRFRFLALRPIGLAEPAAGPCNDPANGSDSAIV